MESMRRSLLALGCPFATDFSIENSMHCVTLVRWLEDRKIRELDISDRHILEEGPSWNDGFQQYLVNLGCPFLASDSTTDKLSWLVGHAISLECEDKGIDGKAPVCETGPSIDITHKVNEIAVAAGLQRELNESNYDLLNRIYQSLKTRVSVDAVAAREQDYTSTTAGNRLLTQFPLGFDTKDAVVNKVALVLKMLYLSDFRDLQNEVNSLLVLVQECTANPRLNAALGRVGT